MHQLAYQPRACTKTSVVYWLSSSSLCLFVQACVHVQASVLVQDKKTLAYYKIYHFSVNYGYIILYNTFPWGLGVYKGVSKSEREKKGTKDSNQNFGELISNLMSWYSKLMCLSEIVSLWLTIEITLIYYKISSFSVNYKPLMFYSTEPKLILVESLEIIG